MGNLTTAQLAVEALQGLMADAVFLDEEAFTNAATLQLYQRRLQVSAAASALRARLHAPVGAAVSPLAMRGWWRIYMPPMLGKTMLHYRAQLASAELLPYCAHIPQPGCQCCAL
jgi:hypothetical protein